MADYFWNHWLQQLLMKCSNSTRRLVRRHRLTAIEGLEDRLLLSGSTPIATPIGLVTFEDQPLAGQLLAADAEADPLVFHAGPLAPVHGQVMINADGSFQYIPAINFHGTDSFSFYVSDGTSNSAPATVTMTVTSVNDIPTIIDGSANLDEDLAFPGSVVNRVNDADVDNLTFSVVQTTAHGTLTLNPNGTFTYTPNADFTGQDSFTFLANDGQVNSPTATFHLTVNPVDDPLKVTFPSGTAQVARTSTPVRIDPAASLTDIDSAVNYGKTLIRTTFIAGNSKGDYNFGRIILRLQDQGSGPGLVHVKGSKVYYDGSSTPIATVSGGSLGHALVIQFTSAATEQAVNAVLKQISLQASKKATLGSRTVQVVITAGKQKAVGSRTVTVV